MDSAEYRCRYLFSPESSRFLKSLESNVAIASTCLKYLRSHCFDPTLSDEEFLAGITRGAYALQGYVVTYWLDHVVQACSHGMSSQVLQKISYDIEKMIDLRKNRDFFTPQNHRSIIHSLNAFQEQSDELFETLLNICSFNQRKRREYSISNGKNVELLFKYYVFTQGIK